MRGRAGVLAFGLVLTAGCASSGGTSPTGAPSSGPSATSSVPVTEPAAVRDDLAAVFERAGVRGTFVLLEMDGGRLTYVDRQRAERPMIPASTFKIVNSLIALETGAVRDEHEVLPYGGRPQPIKAWERDMSLREAIKVSNVAIYQEVARRIGPERMREWVERLGYGNRRIGPVIDRFWLDGPLEISAGEQARFLARLARRQLPMSERSQRIVRDLVRLERIGDATLYGKTGWRSGGGAAQLGWWVGWVERGGRIFCFAMNIDMAGGADADKRIPLGTELLGRLGVTS